MTATRNPPTNKLKQKSWVGLVGVVGPTLLVLFVLPFLLVSLSFFVFVEPPTSCHVAFFRFFFWDRKQLWCDCSVCRSVGGIQLAAQRRFCRQRSYQRDHARSRPIAEAKPVWARSVLPWVTRWESRVMLLSPFFFFSSPTLSLSLFSFFFLISSSHTHTHAHCFTWLVGWFIWMAVSLFLLTHTHSLSCFLFWACVLLLLPALACSLPHTHAHTQRDGWLENTLAHKQLIMMA